MELTKKGHACVALHREGRTLVIDPGGFSEADAAVGADAILVTHEHPDHFDESRLRAALEANPAAEIWTPRSVAERISAAFPGRVHTVGGGDAFTAAGFEVEAHGELHAVIHPDIRRVTNIGYAVTADGVGTVFHPGDALTVPGRPVDTLLLPVHAPWSKVAEVVDYVREVRPRVAYDVHDGLLSDFGHLTYGRLLGPDGPGTAGAEHTRLEPGQSVVLRQG
ncbi:MBL fold metallo-hydrolase [Streptomyces sp. CNQ085]|uniref:MBL fold metallo-hydrolase n=1 Tax=Streptomyces sp. CNQ085 TaxID=2886944 RepID=UPI001F514075|nr:MBL fold metallo-hydrolase [Streptomyces sp. CNQ085]MCI0386706.1 MBL fold metallo-hydrolase [Streptomyces sp. CNQ085]